MIQLEKQIKKHDFKGIFETILSLNKYNNKKDCTSNSGIYFLWQDDIIVYIGISQNIHERLYSGRDPHFEMKKFNYYSFVEIQKENEYLNKLEFVLINFFNPIDNSMMRKQIFLNELPIDYKNKIKIYEQKKALENAMMFHYYFNLN
jgi:hypothetical protein